jgi:hypothetical protein
VNVAASLLRGLGRGGASEGPGRREGDGVGCIVTEMALGSRIPPWQAKTIAVILYQHNDSVGTSNWALQILDKLCRLHRILPLPSFSLSSSTSSTAFPSLAVFGFEQQVLLTTRLHLFEGLVLIEVCGMDIHIPPPLGFFALWQKVVQANRSITTTSSKQNTSGMLAGLSSCHQLPDADVSIIRFCSCTLNNVNIKVSYHCHCVQCFVFVFNSLVHLVCCCII